LTNKKQVTFQKIDVDEKGIEAWKIRKKVSRKEMERKKDSVNN